MVELIEQTYENNEKFRDYVNKFARDNGILPAQAITYQSCINYFKYITESGNVTGDKN